MGILGSLLITDVIKRGRGTGWGRGCGFRGRRTLPLLLVKLVDCFGGGLLISGAIEIFFNMGIRGRAEIGFIAKEVGDSGAFLGAGRGGGGGGEGGSCFFSGSSFFSPTRK